MSRNAFTCFSSECGARGNVLDFVAAMERCSVRDAALKLRDWFKIGDSGDPKKESEKDLTLTPGAIDSLKALVAELEVHNSRIAYHASMVEAKTTAVKQIVARLEKEV